MPYGRWSTPASTSPSSAATAVQPAYDERYYREEFGLDDLRPLSRPWWAIRYYGVLCRRLLRASGGRRFCDVGCAHGWILAWLDSEFETWGLDVSEYAIARARNVAPRAHTVVHDVTHGFPESLRGIGFDLILMRYVLEHLADPGAAIAAAAAELAPRGALLFSVPNTASPGRRWKGERWFGYRDRTHCSLLEPGTWERLARDAGLRIERTWSDGLWDVPYVRGVPALVQLAVVGAPAIAQVLAAGTFLPPRWGENLLVLARRPG